MINNLAKTLNVSPDVNQNGIIKIQGRSVPDALIQAKEAYGPDFFIIEIFERSEFVEIFISLTPEAPPEKESATPKKVPTYLKTSKFQGDIKEHGDIEDSQLDDHASSRQTHIRAEKDFPFPENPSEHSFRAPKGGIQSLLTFKHPADAIRFIDSFSKDHLLSKSFSEAWIQKTMMSQLNGDFSTLKALQHLFVESTFQSFINDHLFQDERQLITFLGTSGSGKTVLVAKCAAYFLAMGLPVRVVTVDASKAGSIAQIKFYLDELKVPLFIGEKLFKKIFNSKGENYYNLRYVKFSSVR